MIDTGVKKRPIFSTHVVPLNTLFIFIPCASVKQTSPNSLFFQTSFILLIPDKTKNNRAYKTKKTNPHLSYILTFEYQISFL